MLLTLEIFALITMITIIFVLLWSFVILNKIYAQLKYKNYMMEKLNQHMQMLSKRELNRKEDN